MDDSIGSIIVYLILAVLGVIGSLNKGKKQASGSTKPRKPGTLFDMGEVIKPAAPKPADKPAPQFTKQPAARQDKPVFSFEIEEEGNYEEPYAQTFSDEGKRYDPLASSFASEGVSAFDKTAMKASLYEEDISSTEIKGISVPDSYDFSDEISEEGVDLRKAVIYSEILNRREYAF